MSRYIDADAMDKRRIDYIVDGYADSADDMAEWGMAIIEAPSIDIVRCSECVYCNVQNTKYLYAICERHGIEFKPFEDDTRMHGCAWGSGKPNNSKERSE